MKTTCDKNELGHQESGRDTPNIFSKDVNLTESLD